MKLCVRLGQLSATAPVVLQQFSQFVVFLPRQSVELCHTDLDTFKPGPQTSTRLPHTQLLRCERLQMAT